MADLKALLGDAYQEDMTLEEINEVLAKKDLIEKKELDNYVPKDTFDKAASQVADYKKKLRATLTEAEQKAQEEKERQESIETELKSLRRSSAIAGLEKNYLGLGYDAETASKIAEATHDNDMETVFDLQKKFLDNKQKAIKAEIMKNVPGAVSGNNVDIDFDKQIHEAQQSGDWPQVSALLRQKAASTQIKE
jgi:hypothetical protein